MRSLLILPLLASANLHGLEFESDEHLSLLQHQARKVMGGDDQIPGPPAREQRMLCEACFKGTPEGRRFGFCGVTARCAHGDRAETEPIEEECPHGRGASTLEQCVALDAAAAPAPEPQAPAAEPPAPVDPQVQVLPAPVPEAPAPQWDYEEPAKWRTIPGAGQCGGGRQSPIDVNRHQHMPRLGAQVQAQYKATQLKALENNGHTLKVDGTFGTLRTPRGVYTAQTIKFHFPSEHTFDGVNADGEMHIVHTLNNNPNLFAVLAVPLKVGRPMSYQFDALHAIGLYNYPDDARLKPGEKKALSSTLNLQEALKPQLQGDFYTYDGSLTTPPCQETVIWYVAATPMKVGWRMPTDFNLEFGKFGNNRPTQARNNRPVRVMRFLQAGQAFVPEQDPPDDDDTPEHQAPPQEPEQNNDDVLTGDEAANEDDVEADPKTWNEVQGRDGDPLENEDGELLFGPFGEDNLEEAKHACAKTEECVGLVIAEEGLVPYSDLDGVGDLKAILKPTAPEAPEDDDEDDAGEDDAGDEDAGGEDDEGGEVAPPPIADEGPAEAP